MRTACVDLDGPTEFRGLVEIALSALRLNDVPTPITVRLNMLTAMGRFGPEQGFPTDKQCEVLQGYVTELCDEDDLGAIFDLVAAFGCGWQRNTDFHSNAWTGLWDLSFLSLVKRVRLICYRVSELLNDRFSLRYPTENGIKLSMSAASTFVAEALIQPSAPVSIHRSLGVMAGGVDGDPIFSGLSVTTDAGWHEEIRTGARAVYQCVQGNARVKKPKLHFEAGDVIRMTSSETRSNIQIREGHDQVIRKEIRPTAGKSFSFQGNVALTIRACTCGRRTCAQLHRLDAWNPAAEYGSLKNFLLNAIRGTMQAFAAKDFASNLLGSYWARHGCDDGSRLRLAEVAHHACLSAECHEQGENDTIHYYVGNQCDRCNSGANDDTPLVIQERLIVVGAAIESWEFKEYWRCANDECGITDLNPNIGPLIDATSAVKKKAWQCNACGGNFFGEDAINALSQCIAGSKTLLTAARELDELRLRSQCQNCDAQGSPAAYCSICERHERTNQLPGMPRWLFAPAIPN